jgi:hypothetical protein
MFWVYELPNIAFAALTIAAFLAFGLGGLMITRGWIRKAYAGHNYNDIVSYYFSACGVFFALYLALVAAGTWTTRQAVESKVDEESFQLAALYRNVLDLPEPHSSSLEKHLREYTRFVIDKSWENQRKGIASNAEEKYLDLFEEELDKMDPKTDAERELHSECLNLFNQISESRRRRMSNISTGLSGALWVVLVFGCLLVLSISWFFTLPSLQVHLVLTALLSVMIGTLMYIIAAIDYPLRGHLGVSSDSFSLMFDQLMKGH